MSLWLLAVSRYRTDGDMGKLTHLQERAPFLETRSGALVRIEECDGSRVARPMPMREAGVEPRLDNMSHELSMSALLTGTNLVS